jgi:hypothetical protein
VEPPEGAESPGELGGAGAVAEGTRGEKEGGPGVGGLGVKGLGGACADTSEGTNAAPRSTFAKARPNGRIGPRR